MKPTDQIIAIATALEWTDVSQGVGPNSNIFLGTTPPKNGASYCDKRVSDYLGDLNACADFEKSIPYVNQPYYLQHLKRVIMQSSDIGAAGEFEQTCATAPQRAEAFLKLIGKWVDTP